MYILNSISQSDYGFPACFHTSSNHHEQENINHVKGMSSYQILAIIDGKGTVECNGKTYPLYKGCAFYTAPSIPVKYTNEGGLVSIFVTARGNAINEICQTFAPSGFAFFENVDIDKMLDETTKIENEFCSERRQCKLSILTYAFFLEFFESNAHDSDDDYLTKAISFIDKNFTKKITLDEIAKQCGVSVSKLCYDFRQKYGKTVFEHVINQRLNYARAYLSNSSSIRVKDVSLTCGFDDVVIFVRRIKTNLANRLL
jgi:AraC-like DNA-binding protein